MAAMVLELCFFSLFLFGGGPYEGEPQNAAIEKALDCQLLNPWATNEPTKSGWQPGMLFGHFKAHTAAAPTIVGVWQEGRHCVGGGGHPAQLVHVMAQHLRRVGCLLTELPQSPPSFL